MAEFPSGRVWTLYQTAIWVCEISAKAWAGYQSRRGPHGAQDREEASDGSVLAQLTRLDRATHDHDPVGPEDDALVDAFLALQDEMEAAVLLAVAGQHPRWRAALGEACCMDEEDLEAAVPKLTSPEDLRAQMGLHDVHLFDVVHGGEHYVGLEFGCAWEDEHGLGVLLHGSEVIALGHADCSFDERLVEQHVKGKPLDWGGGVGPPSRREAQSPAGAKLRAQPSGRRAPAPRWCLRACR